VIDRRSDTENLVAGLSGGEEHRFEPVAGADVSPSRRRRDALEAVRSQKSTLPPPQGTWTAPHGPVVDRSATAS